MLGNLVSKNVQIGKHIMTPLRLLTSVSFSKSDDSTKKLFPKVSQYAPFICAVKQGEQKSWCRCGLSNKQPWCDGSHKGIGFRSLKWVAPETKEKYIICGCKHSKNQPFCDGTHKSLRPVVEERQSHCPDKKNHCESTKLCTTCGWSNL